MYLNHAAAGPWPRCAAEAVQQFAEENMLQGSMGYREWYKREIRLRASLARLTGAAGAADIALLKNTSEGICTVAFGLDWQAGDNVVLPAGEFPSNRLPWLAQSVHGVEIREVDIRSAADAEQALLDAMDRNTRLLSVSAVQWSDGFKLDLHRLGSHCRRHGILFFVDAIQQLGALPMDVQSCHIDFLAADAHKWLLAPEGIAVFYCREGARERLSISQHGWRMVDNPYQFARSSWAPSKTAMRFEAGSPNTLGQAALHASIGLLQDFGMEQVEKNIVANSYTLSAGLMDIPGIELSRPFDQQRVSGIVSFRPPDGNPVRTQKILQGQGLSCTVRANAIRLSPHFYQSGKPVRAMLDLIEDSVK